MPLLRRVVVALLLVWASTVASAAPIQREHVTFVCTPGDRCPSSRGRMGFTITTRGYILGEAEFVDGASCLFFDYQTASGAQYRCEDAAGHAGASGTFRLTLGQHPPC